MLLAWLLCIDGVRVGLKGLPPIRGKSAIHLDPTAIRDAREWVLAFLWEHGTDDYYYSLFLTVYVLKVKEGGVPQKARRSFKPRASTLTGGD